MEIYSCEYMRWLLSCHELLGTKRNLFEVNQPRYLGTKKLIWKSGSMYILYHYYLLLANSAILFQLSSQINHDFMTLNSKKFFSVWHVVVCIYCMWFWAILVARKNIILFAIHGIHVRQMYNFVLHIV